MPTGRVNISMSSDTVEQLKKNGFLLYGCKAVKTMLPSSALPLVWFVASDYLINTTISWQDNYQAYISNQKIVPGDVIEPCPLRNITGLMKDLTWPVEREEPTISRRMVLKSLINFIKNITACSSQVIALGQSMLVDNNGNTSVIAEGIKDAISIRNQGRHQWSCGISQRVTTLTPNPLCTMPLFGNSSHVIIPINKVFVSFASRELIKIGIPISQSVSTSGILVDLTSAERRDLKYDLNNGWKPTNQVWAKTVTVGSNLTQLLIEPM